MAIAKKRKRNYILQTWDKLPPTGKVVVTGAAVVGVYSLYKNIKSNIADKKAKQELEKLTKESNTPFVVTTGANQGVIQHVDLATVATKLHDALHYGPFGLLTDDESIMRLLLPIPKPYIQNLEYIYQKVYGDNLDNKLNKGMWRYNYNQIRYLFL